MAFLMNYNLKIKYTLGMYDTKEDYKDKLTEEQFNQLDDIEKNFTIQDAYYKIDSINGTKDQIEIKVAIYKDSLKQVSYAVKAYKFTPIVDEESLNFIKQGYEYLKTLEEYADAVDC